MTRKTRILVKWVLWLPVLRPEMSSSSLKTSKKFFPRFKSSILTPFWRLRWGLPLGGGVPGKWFGFSRESTLQWRNLPVITMAMLKLVSRRVFWLLWHCRVLWLKYRKRDQNGKLQCTGGHYSNVKSGAEMVQKPNDVSWGACQVCNSNAKGKVQEKKDYWCAGPKRPLSGQGTTSTSTFYCRFELLVAENVEWPFSPVR